VAWLVLTHPPGQPGLDAERLVDELTGAGGWTKAFNAFCLVVLTNASHGPSITPLVGAAGVGGVVLGRVFDRAATDAGRVADAALDGLVDLQPIEACARLISGAWGGYVAIFASKRSEPPTVLRDPSGALEAYVWRKGDVTLIGSEVPDGAEPAELAIDWSRLGAILASPARGAGAPPLVGIQVVDPGSCRHGPGGRQQTVLWEPAGRIRAAGRRRGAGVSQLRATVEACTAALADGAQTILCEISGGLDSAIVATTLAAVGRPAHAAINFYRRQAEADERAYAQHAASRAGVALTTVLREPTPLDAETFELSARAPRPNFNAVDPSYDAGLCQAITAAQADVLFTGHGGDVVFLQVGASALARELLAGRPCEGHRLARLADIARRMRRSVWSLAWEALTRRPSRWTMDAVERPRLVTVAPSHDVHPWLKDLHGVPSAKRAQVHGLVMGLILMEPTRRADLARLAHPLLTQPVIELCLSIPAPILCSGDGDRTLARAAFADRLPSSIVERRSKGDVSVYLGRNLAGSLDYLRPLLLEGRLAAKGLIDRAAVDQALTHEAMIWKDTTVDVLAAATLEAWVRHWEARIASLASATSGGSTASTKSNARA
jgi:asparagine synthase (glutamine-hydrolysing)